ncbi:MAG: sulfotransferase family 2 domain-containing protein [Gammaproteobacteria bacterium]|nr:sulfotransferase family 2 domain-containing protein [Gammaproteobacteria bacterium]
MIISYSRRFIFLKTRKTAGSSIQMALSEICGNDDIIVSDDRNINSKDIGRNIERSFSRNTHANLAQIRLALLEDEWSSFFKFAFVRNPWDLVVSRYHWGKKGKQCSVSDFREWLQKYTDADYAKPECNEQANIVQRVWEIGGGFITDLQTPFVFEGKTKGIQFVGRYENISDDFDKLCKALEIAPLTLPHLKVGFREGRSYHHFYDTVARLLVNRAFAEDIENFAYTF